MNKKKTFTIRLDEELFNKMEEHKEKNDINWSAKIRRFILEELAKPSESNPINVITNNDKPEQQEEESESAIECYNRVSNELNNIYKTIHDIDKRRKMHINRKADDKVYEFCQKQAEKFKRELEILERINFLEHYENGEDE